MVRLNMRHDAIYNLFDLHKCAYAIRQKKIQRLVRKKIFHHTAYTLHELFHFLFLLSFPLS